jgi:hypothetical protein
MNMFFLSLLLSVGFAKPLQHTMPWLNTHQVIKDAQQGIELLQQSTSSVPVATLSPECNDLFRTLGNNKCFNQIGNIAGDFDCSCVDPLRNLITSMVPCLADTDVGGTGYDTWKSQVEMLPALLNILCANNGKCKDTFTRMANGNYFPDGAPTEAFLKQFCGDDCLFRMLSQLSSVTNSPLTASLPILRVSTNLMCIRDGNDYCQFKLQSFFAEAESPPEAISAQTLPTICATGATCLRRMAPIFGQNGCPH